MSTSAAGTVVQLHEGRPCDEPLIRALLVDCGLPVSDLDASHVRFVVAYREDRLVGVAGLEAHGDVALLRSVAVDTSTRGTGLGGRLVESIETRAKASGMRDVILLTTTAASFFAARGFEVINRSEAPAAVQASTEFRGLCPASAVCMRRRMTSNC